MLLSHPSGEISAGLCLKPCCIALPRRAGTDVRWELLQRDGVASEQMKKV